MRVEVGQVVPAAHVRGLVEDAEQRRREPAAGRCRGELFGGLDDRAVSAVTSGPAVPCPSFDRL